MKRNFIPVALALLLSVQASAQYAPQAGIGGSTAIPANSPQIVNWASACSVQRGWMDIGNPQLGLVSSGDSSLAIGPAEGYTVSLGDSGVAVLQFPAPIVNGPGPDFAVFENGFLDPTDSELAFLELAFVEVSSDGVNYFRFPASSLTQVDVQIAGAGVYMSARAVHNLAGKYIHGFGTPFDLEELDNTPGLDISHVTHVRIVDVIGSVDKHASLDKDGNIINDPYPTPFNIGGFDLDGVAVLHQGATHVSEAGKQLQVKLFPNPTTDRLSIVSQVALDFSICDLTGKQVLAGNVSGTLQLNISALQSGMYLVAFKDSKGRVWQERFAKL